VRQLGPFGGIVGRYHRVFFRQIPLGPVGARRQLVVGAQMALEHGHGPPTIQADDMLGPNRLFHRYRWPLGRFDRLGIFWAWGGLKSLVDRGDQGGQIGDRHAVVRHVGANDFGNECEEAGLGRRRVGHGYSYEVAGERVSRSAFAALNLTERLAAISMAAPV